MGLCLSCDPITNDIDRHLNEETRKDFAIKKLLFLGAGGAGKSTIFKQLRAIHDQPMTEVERREHVETIRTEMVTNMITLVKKSRQLARNATKHKRFLACRPPSSDTEMIRFMDIIHAAPAEAIGPHNVEMIDMIKRLWNYPPIQATWGFRKYYAIPECAKYFFDNIDRVCGQDYRPTEEDILFARVRTTGIVTATFEMSGNKFEVVDVGGQRNERKKWAHCFSNVTAVIFVASLSGYCEVLFEDERKNGMAESLQIFETVTNSDTFRDKDIILFLNKYDLFIERLAAGNSLRQCEAFKSEYDGFEYDPANGTKDDLERAVAEGLYFIQGKYSKLKQHHEFAVYIHITEATDRDKVEKVFWDVQNIVLRGALRKGHLL